MSSEVRTLSLSGPGELAFHLKMALVIAAIVLGSLLGCLLTGISIPNLGSRAMADLLIFGALQPVPLYWHKKGRIDLRDTSLVLIWAALLWTILSLPVDIAARLSRGIPLRDPLLAHLDAMAGVNVAGVVQWAAHHAIGRMLNASYDLLIPMLVLAFALPALAARVRCTKRLLVANLLAFAIGLLLFALVPATGPWTMGSFAPSIVQIHCQADVQQIRALDPFVFRAVGIVCFPSFHVTWAILSAWALWELRWLRIPATLLGAAIVLSTLTTGWHYFADVLGGLVVAGVAIAAAQRLVHS